MLTAQGPQNSGKGLPGEDMTGVQAEALCQGCRRDMMAGRGQESDSLRAPGPALPGPQAPAGPGLTLRHHRSEESRTSGTECSPGNRTLSPAHPARKQASISAWSWPADASLLHRLSTRPPPHAPGAAALWRPGGNTGVKAAGSDTFCALGGCCPGWATLEASVVHILPLFKPLS